MHEDEIDTENNGDEHTSRCDDAGKLVKCEGPDDLDFGARENYHRQRSSHAKVYVPLIPCSVIDHESMRLHIYHIKPSGALGVGPQQMENTYSSSLPAYCYMLNSAWRR